MIDLSTRINGEIISRAYCMDNMEFMSQVPYKFYNLGLIDPPYGINRDGGFGGFKGFKGFGKPIERIKYKGKWDDKTPDQIYFTELLRVCSNVIIWGGQFFTDKLPVCGHWIFWDKLNTMPTFGDGELAYTNFDRNSVKRFVHEYNGLLGREKGGRIHATQKPIPLYKWLLTNYAKPGDKIFDSHLGSQSSRIAAYHLGFDFWGTEIDKDYFKDGCERFERECHETVTLKDGTTIKQGTFFD
jgi:site-specific DNA-methyltransferase (adenine-specific)